MGESHGVSVGSGAHACVLTAHRGIRGGHVVVRCVKVCNAAAAAGLQRPPYHTLLRPPTSPNTLTPPPPIHTNTQTKTSKHTNPPARSLLSRSSASIFRLRLATTTAGSAGPTATNGACSRDRQTEATCDAICEGGGVGREDCKRENTPVGTCACKIVQGYFVGLSRMQHNLPPLTA